MKTLFSPKSDVLSLSLKSAERPYNSFRLSDEKFTNLGLLCSTAVSSQLKRNETQVGLKFY